jgi:hypothetical protein
MLYINEWLPNPMGPDAGGEFIELYNNGATAIALSGYTLGIGAKKKLSLSGYGSIAQGGYLVLKKTQTKLALKNADGALFLYGSNGQLVDRASFVGSAPEGKSFSRINYDSSSAQHFVFTDPTPGARNKMAGTMISSVHYPEGVSLSSRLSLPSFFLLTIGVAATILLLFIYIFIKNENLSHYLFGGDEANR